MSKNNNTSGGGVGFLSLLQIAFIVLKLARVIAWSWWWVLAPTWVGLLLFIITVILVVFTASKH